MTQHIAMLITISGLSLGAFLSTCLGGSSGDDPNQVGSQPAQAEKASGDANHVSALHSDADRVKAVNEAPTPVESRVNRVLSLDGQDDCMRVADSQSLQSFTDAITIEVSLMASSLYMEDGKINSVVRKNVASRAENFLLRFRTIGGSPRAQMGLGALGTLQAPSEFAANNWYHLAGTYDGRAITIFVNGLPVASQNASGRLHIDQSDLYIGKGDPTSFSSGEYFHGVLDEVRIWNVARSQEQIQAAMNASLTGKEEGLLAYWNFDDGTAKDLSGHGNNGILDGDARIVESSRPTLAASEQKQMNQLVAWWRFENDVNDSAGANHGTIHGNRAFVDGKIGQALSLDGAACVDCGQQDLLDFGAGDWTISAWIKTTKSGIGVADKETVFANGADELGGVRYTLAVNEMDSGRVTLTTDDDTVKAQATGQTAINDDAWHHVIGTREGGTLRVYVDGALDGTSDLPGKYDLAGASKQNAYIGAIKDNRDGSLYKYFVGQIDEVCVFACALGDSDAKALYSGTEPMMIADSIRIRAARPVTAAPVTVAAAPQPPKKTYGKWFALAVILVAGGMGAWVYWSRRRWRRRRAAADMARKDLGRSLRHIAHGVPGMTWQIARKEFLLNLMTFKFAVGTAVCVVLMAVLMPGLVNDYEDQLANYNGNVAANQAEFQSVKAYKQLTPTVYRTPTVLSVFSKGIVDRLESSERIDVDEVSGSASGVGEANTLLSVFPAMDVTLILKIVISVLALLMAYDVISGEREQGTLRLILSNTAPRHQVLLGKLLAGWMSLAVPVTAAFIVGLLILLMSKAIGLTGADWIRIALMYLVSLIFVASMFNLGLLLSSVSRNSAISLVFVLFLWLIFAAILPNASAHLAVELQPIESPEQFTAKLRAITEQRDREINELTTGINSGDTSQSDSSGGAFGNGFIMFCNKAYVEYWTRFYAITEPHKTQCIDKLLDVKAAYLSSLVRQKQVADILAGVTPIVLCERLMSTLAGTDFSNFGSFKNRVRAYRHEVADYIANKTANFAATIYFTPSKEGDQERFFATFFKAYNEAQDPALKAKLYKEATEKYGQAEREAPSLALEDFPAFTYRSQPIAVTLQQAIPAIGLLIFQGVLFFALSFVAFLRYDVR